GTNIAPLTRRWRADLSPEGRGEAVYKPSFNRSFRMTDLGLLINNQESEASGGGTFERNNPVTGELATRAAAATVDDALRAADAAATAFPGWSTTAPAARRKILLAAADRLQART